MQQGWIRIDRWRPFGAEVSIHWSVVAIAVAAVVLVARDPAFMAWVLASYFVVLVVHEFAHAAMARARGMRPTLIEFAPFHGRCTYAGRDSQVLDHVLVAWAGPVAQLAVATVVLMLSRDPTVRGLDAFGPVLVFTGYFNVAWAVMNLLPVRGADGEQAWRIVPILRERLRAKHRRKDRPPLRRIK
jgi:Zn-dependent protease